MLRKFAQDLGDDNAGAAVYGPLDEGPSTEALGRRGGQELADDDGEVFGDERVDLHEQVPLDGRPRHGGQLLDEIGERFLAGIFQNQLGLLGGIAHGGCQLGAHIGGRVGEDGRYELAHGAGAVAHQMGERIVLPVDIRGEQLGAPRQGERSFQERDFRRRFLGGGVQFREGLQVGRFRRVHRLSSLLDRRDFAAPLYPTPTPPRPSPQKLRSRLP